jgi:hypothetical protein
MDSIAIDCPACSEKLEVDSGFAGGVCRCSNCGMLMTVPRDPARERAEVLTRPKRPDAPEARGGPAKPAAPGAAPAAAAGATAGEQEFTTQSGKAIKVSDAQVPMARRRRKAINAGVIAGFVVFVVAIVAVVIFAIAAMSRSGTKPTVDANVATRDVMGGYDPNINPFKTRTLNLLGVPLGQTPALVIDGSAQGRSWLPLVLDSVAAQFRNDSQGRVAQVVVWGENEPRTFPDKPGSLNAQHARLADFLNGIVPLGVGEPLPALAAALEGQPSQVVLVTGQSLSDSQIDAIGKLMAERGAKVRLDVVVINADPAGLADLAQKSGGLTVDLPTQRIAAWAREAEAQTNP